MNNRRTTFFEELKRRKVVRVFVAYVVVAWAVLQVADVVFPALGLPSWSITLTLGLLVALFPVALVLTWVFDFTPRGIERTDSAGPRESTLESLSEPASPADDKSIAVLPFLDLSAERNQEHFCDGLTDELLNVLTRIPGLRVASRTSSFAFKGKNVGLGEVAERLRVAHVLEGSVRKSGSKIRITAQLIEATSDSHLWSETYDRELEDIFAIQDDIAACILAALKLKLGDYPLEEATTSDAQAWEMYLRGRGYVLTRVTQDHARATALLRRAVERDPGFVRAWVGLAEVSANAHLYHEGGKPALEQSMEAARRAEELAPERSDTHMARGFAHLAQHDYAVAQREFLEALERNPREPQAWHYAGRAAHFQGDAARALDYFTRATEEDPNDWESPLLALQFHQARMDEDGARRVARTGLERARCYLESYPDSPRPWYLGAAALLALGEADEGVRWVNRALELSPDDNATRYNAACFFAIAGETERALDLLENSITSRSWIENDPELESLRGHPRYQAIIEALPE